MHTKRTTPVTLIAACFIVFVAVGLFATSAIMPNDSRHNDMPAAKAALEFY